jgi:hypothetical protein
MEIKAIETEYRGYRFRSRIEARWAVCLDALGIKWEYEKEGYALSNGEKYLPDFYIPRQQNIEQMFIEVKGAEPTEDEKHKCFMLAEASGMNVMLLSGSIGYQHHDGVFYNYEFSSRMYSGYRSQEGYKRSREFFAIELPKFLADNGYEKQLPPSWWMFSCRKHSDGNPCEEDYIKAIIDLDRHYYTGKYNGKQHSGWAHGVVTNSFFIDRYKWIGAGETGDVFPADPDCQIFQAIDAARSARFEHGESGVKKDDTAAMSAIRAMQRKYQAVNQ